MVDSRISSSEARNRMCDSDRYAKVAEVGSGTYSKVYSLRDDSLVMKCVSSCDLGYVSSSVLWDIAIPTTLRHRNVAKIHKIFYRPEEVQIVMPKYRPIDNLDLNIMYKLLHALYYIHSNNIIHRDIKKENIMMDGDEPIIIDFSISRVGLLPNMSTQSYTEGCRHKSVSTGKYGYEADVYALGMTFLSILLDYTQNELAKIWMNSVNVRLKSKGVIGEIVKMMIDEDNIPSLQSLLSLEVFKNMKEPLYNTPMYRPTRSITSGEEARIGMSIYVYAGQYISSMRGIVMNLYKQGGEQLTLYRREIIDLATAITDDHHQYDLSINLLSVLAEGLCIA